MVAKGSRLSAETIRKIREARAKQVITEEHKQHIREGLKKAYSEDRHKIIPPIHSQSHSEETKKKMREKRALQIITEQTKQKISETLKRKEIRPPVHSQKGFCHSRETKKKISLANIGHKHTNEWKRRQSLMNSGTNHPFYGKHHSIKSKQKIKKARLHQIFPIKDTIVETKVQYQLSQMKVNFEKHKPILGQPDIFIKPNICIFVDGCYWHNCGQCFNKNKFTDKQRAKIVYDQSVTQQLINQGYIVLRFWEHDINDNFGKVKKEILNILKKRFFF